jgi:L-iditol 2-dehydrogenase
VSAASSATYRRSVLVGHSKARIESMSVPADPGPNELLLQVLLNGVCASDLPTWSQGPRGLGAITLGHEPVGRVIAVGPGVETPAIGDIVTGRLPHSYADMIVARAADAVIVPANVPLKAAVGEPLGCIVEALRRSRVDVGDRVAVVGLGFMGLCLLQLLTASAVGDVTAVDTREEARKQALAHGAQDALAPQDVLTQRGMVDSFDAVFEVTGVQAGLDAATRLTRAHGTLTIVGYHQGPQQVDMREWNWKALDIVNGHVRDERRLADSTRRGLDVVASGRVDYASLFTHRYSLDQIDGAFEDLRSKPAGFIKAVIAFEDGR